SVTGVQTCALPIFLTFAGFSKVCVQQALPLEATQFIKPGTPPKVAGGCSKARKKNNLEAFRGIGLSDGKVLTGYCYDAQAFLVRRSGEASFYCDLKLTRSGLPITKVGNECSSGCANSTPLCDDSKGAEILA